MNQADPVHSGRTILTALYLCMLAVCFLVPIFFYFRMHCDERRNRHLRDLEIANMARAMTESQAQQMEESRAARRKYREERRARINQLFSPVRTILARGNFVRADSVDTIGASPTYTAEKSDATMEISGIPKGASKPLEELLETQLKSCPDSTKGDCEEVFDCDDFILVPKAGLPHGAAMYEFSSNATTCTVINNPANPATRKEPVEVRKIPNECSICLCEYTVGSDIVWSSNPKCEHVFHTACIEEWLMKQRDGPLCPCCRRDFVIDPFDNGRGETDDLEKGDSRDFSRSRSRSSSHSRRRRARELSPVMDAGVEETVLIAMMVASIQNPMTRLDESDGSSSDVPPV